MDTPVHSLKSTQHAAQGRARVNAPSSQKGPVAVVVIVLRVTQSPFAHSHPRFPKKSKKGGEIGDEEKYIFQYTVFDWNSTKIQRKGDFGKNLFFFFVLRACSDHGVDLVD